MGIEANLQQPQRRTQAPADQIVRLAFEAFRRRDVDGLLELLDPELEFQPVSALGLSGRTGHGHRGVEAWIEGIERSGVEPLALPRRFELVGKELVLACGVLSERGRMAGRFAAQVAWVFRVRGGRIVSAFGYSSEAAARRAISDSS